MLFLSALSQVLFTKYKNEISKFPLLSKKEEDELILRKESGNIKAREKLINCNLRLVLWVLSYGFKRGQEVGRKQVFSSLDLIQFGNIGLIKAVDRVKVKPDSRLKDLAIWMIKKEMLRGLIRNFKIIRITEQKNSLLRKVQRFEDDFINHFERNPETFEIAEAFKQDPKILSHILNISKEIIYLEDVLQPDIDEIKKFLEWDNEGLIREEVLEYIFQLASFIASNKERLTILRRAYPDNPDFGENDNNHLVDNAYYANALRKIKKLVDPKILKRIMET